MNAWPGVGRCWLGLPAPPFLSPPERSKQQLPLEESIAFGDMSAALRFCAIICFSSSIFIQALMVLSPIQPLVSGEKRGAQVTGWFILPPSAAGWCLPPPLNRGQQQSREGGREGGGSCHACSFFILFLKSLRVEARGRK